MDPIHEAYEKLWADLDKNNLFPKRRPLLAHYTSISTFESILRNDELWFSNPLEMNDWEELIFGVREGTKCFKQHNGIREACGSDEIHSKLINYFDYYFREFEEKHAYNTYVLCFSEHQSSDDDGVLSMWRGYGQNGNGISVVIDTSILNNNEESPFIIAPVEYGSVEERIAWINIKLDEFSSFLKVTEQNDKNLYTLAYYWFQRLIVFSLFSKHDGFKEENEWRVVYMSERDDKKILAPMLSYQATDEGLQPKLKLKLNEIPESLGGKIELVKLIHKIILGPTTSSAIAAKTLQRMVEQVSKPSLAKKIVPSLIPFRHKK
ncbi:DUF2971 domain-containing protein [Methylophaga pinxianii]|uniref:DUF2971 domain-containing protein n=1 Tax=Methylophaga pinxianii TaxID=2881052 RepID=UPI001CF12A22|nr:DUF2971 domain-containing protein [Methylophaga pinxianii]MCB2427893.1 DUF2971 domain-containing protein [Methylophaga pinxianii]UPH44683.1 DUF2971 domain-containing protein [Methylophaga pinxianii]